jgi:chromosome segregation ATPase
MNKIKTIVLSTTLTLLLGSVGLVNGCKKETEVKETEVISVNPTADPVVADKDVNVDVHVDNPQQPAGSTIIVDKQESTRATQDMLVLNANLQKLQAQVNSANEQTKAQLNKQIQQMNADKIKLQQQIAAFETKSREAKMTNDQAQKNLDAAREQMEKTKQDYLQLTQQKLSNFEKKLDTLAEKVNYLEATERGEVDKQLSSIQEQKDLINKKITDMQSTIDVATFKNLRSQIDTMFSNLDRSYNRIITDRVSLR